MLHILFLLLKIIGIILLALLCLVVLLVLIVLLVPVRYKVSAAKYSDIEAEAQVSWLLHLLGFFVRFDTGEAEGRRLHLRLRIACFTLYDNLRPRKKRIKKKRVSKTKTRTPEKNVDKSIDADINKISDIDRTADKNIDKTPDTDRTADRNIDKIPDTDRINDDKTDENVENGNVEDENIDDTIYIEETGRNRVVDLLNHILNILKKIAGVCRSILHLPSAMTQKFRHLSDQMTRLLEKKNKLLDIYHDEKNHRWLMLFLGRLKKLVLRMLPKIDRLLWHFGFDDPATTGQVLGFLSVLYPVCRERMVLQPEFQQEVMEGEVRLHGQIRMLPIVVLLVRSFLNRQFFTIVRQVKNI